MSDVARYSKKRSTTWVGYKVHLIESCEAHLPLIVTHVETTLAPVSDDAMTATLHAELERKELLPTEHIVVTSYVDAKLLVESKQDYQIDLVGPTRKDYHWQARESKGFDARHFSIDWEKQPATCPEGHTSISWTPAVDRGENEVIKIKFSRDRLSDVSVSLTLYSINSPYTSHRDDSPTGQIPSLDAEERARKDQGISAGQGLASGY